MAGFRTSNSWLGFWRDADGIGTAGHDGDRTGDSAVPKKPAPTPVVAEDERKPGPARYPVDWSGGGDGYALTSDESVKHGGRASGSIRSLDQARDFASLTQGFWANRYRGKRLRLTGYVRTEDVEGWAGLWMRIDGRDKGGLAFDNMEGRAIRGTTGWRKYAVVLDIPDEAEDIYFGFLMAGKGRAWVDDIAFDVVGNDVPSTDLKIPATENPKGASPGLPREPRNLDFER